MYSELQIEPPQLGADGALHRHDAGFLTIEDDTLVWRGARWRIRLRRQDLLKLDGGRLNSRYLLRLRPDVLGTLKYLVPREIPNARAKYSWSIDRRLYDWFEGASRSE
jgi:hypothetical protein